ncbi:MAG: DUF2608 domain-containing protein [Paraglaciecola sp.]|uniref:DUF2608 domain-containing protein n=1 Tax=Paraglaciecola sp. TaxID=1920173 RepID=UPI0027401EC2|nr:DUF2608 domain-containing protein [Paraglaciecola sp.]MDP5030820.1 DUF2608 domain-containing protein [Paraglaciecola sp.]MDP5129555.1 DUF2608 domain-containing protein [Paraglaciecola sp.]
MKQSLLLILLLLSVSACANSPQPEQSGVVVQETHAFKDVVKTIKQKTTRYNSDNVLVVVDIDNTLLTSESDLGGDIWYQWQRGSLAVKPREEQKVQCLFEDSISLLYELSPMVLTESALPAMINDWQQQGITVFALTSRSPKTRSATERELSRAGIDLSVTALSPIGQDAPLLREFIPREMTYMQGIMMTSGMNKGAMLDYLLSKMQRQFKAIVFVDDSQKNIDNLYEAYKGNGTIDMTIFHYNKVEEDRMKKNGAILSQNQADEMAHQWDTLTALINSIYPSRSSGSCLSSN